MNLSHNVLVGPLLSGISEGSVPGLERAASNEVRAKKSIASTR